MHRTVHPVGTNTQLNTRNTLEQKLSLWTRAKQEGGYMSTRIN